MLKTLLTTCVATLCLTVQSQPSNKRIPDTNPCLFPFLTQNNNYIYVDQEFNAVLKENFIYASPFTTSGYAVVANANKEFAVINNKGKFVVPYTESDITITVVNGLTLVKQETDYEKKLPIWKWEWNIMSSHIKKKAAYQHVLVGILETNQILFDHKSSVDDQQANFNFYPLENNHFVWNDYLYQTVNGRFKKMKKVITQALDKGRYIPFTKSTFEIWDSHTAQPILTQLTGQTSITVEIRNQKISLDSINQDRYAPAVPKVLFDAKKGENFIYPQYDKTFPKQIQVITAQQERFLKESSIIYSVNNSPYFILGKFDYSPDVWAYDWMYLDQQGNFHHQIPITDFFITDQLGYMIWPSPKMIVPLHKLDKAWKLDKVRNVQESGNLFIVRLLNPSENIKQEGLWNRQSLRWEIEPTHTNIQVLDSRRYLYAIQQKKDGNYIVYNNQIKKQVGNQSYTTINANGMVGQKTGTQQIQYYYIDLETGKEYRAM